MKEAIELLEAADADPSVWGVEAILQAMVLLSLQAMVTELKRLNGRLEQDAKVFEELQQSGKGLGAPQDLNKGEEHHGLARSEGSRH